MRIYIDEGGNFQIPCGRDYLLSVVAALVIPEAEEAGVFYDFMRLRDDWGIPALEIKGRQLDEARFAQIIKVLNLHDVVLEFVAIDMAWHTESDLLEFKQLQARKILESLTPEHQPTLVAEMKALGQVVKDIASQLFVQAYMTIELIDRVVQIATLYYSQRIPEELGRFDWVIDRKDRELTAMERLWTTLIIPIGQTRAFEKPFITLREGNYSHFDRFRLDIEASDRSKDVQWLNENVIFPMRSSEVSRIIDMKKVLQESFRFADSKNELGLQLADIVSSACRRAFNGNLQKSGWEELGRLLIKKDGKPPIIGLATPEQAVGRDRRLHEAPSKVWLALDSASKSMWV
jgi:hypothetical protein